MQPKSAVMMRVLLNRYHSGSPASILSCFSEVFTKQVLSQDVASNDPQPALRSSAEKMSKIHFSWYIPLIEKMPNELRPLFIASFPESQASSISHHSKISPETKALSPPVKAYLLEMLYKKLLGADKVLPLEYLPQSSLSPLTAWSKRDIEELIEFLSLHDLSVEMRQIVDQKAIQAIYNCLSGKEQNYLRLCMRTKEKLMSPSLGLDRWSGDCDKLKAVLQSRGLVRFGKALSGEHPEVMWHLIHNLDTGRGQALMKHYSKTPIAGVTPLLSQQVQNLMNILKKKSDV